MANEDCIFCKIAKGEIPCTKVYEDDKCIAFEDLNPCAPVHTLIIPKEHYANVGDNVPQDLLGHLLSVVPEVAKIKGVDKSGYRHTIFFSLLELSGMKMKSLTTANSLSLRKSP